MKTFVNCATLTSYNARDSINNQSEEHWTWTANVRS